MSERIKKIAVVASGPVSYTRMPAAAAFLAGVCESEKIDYEIFDLNILLRTELGQDTWIELATEADLASDFHSVKLDYLLKPHLLLADFFERVCIRIRDGQFDSLAMSVLSYKQHLWTTIFLQQLQKICPDIRVITGGPGIGSTYMLINSMKVNLGRFLVDNDLSDYFVLGEGDIIFRKFLLGEADGLPGFNSKNTLDTWQPQVDDLDQTPHPSYRKFKFENYEFFNGEPEITLTASRGCVRKCTFCDIGHLWKKFRTRSGSKVVDEMYKGYTELGVTKFWFNDSLINGSYKQFFDFLDCLQKKQSQDPGFKNITYGGQLILRNQTTHSIRMYEMLSKTGGKFFQVGVESGSESVRDHMQKKFSNDDIYYHYEMCHKFGIQNWIFLTVGYPTETEKDFQDTLNLLTDLQKYLIDDTIVGSSFTSMSVLENTPLAGMMAELDLLYTHNDSSTPAQWHSASPGGINEYTKYLRWVRLGKHLISLGYRINAEARLAAETSLRSLTQGDPSQTKSVIAIHQILS